MVKANHALSNSALEIKVLTGSFGRPQVISPNKVAKWIKAESKCNIKMFEWNQRIS